MKNRKDKSCQVLHGFTLIELLVVISIIAILIAILMPALSSARDSAIGIQCASNARQIMIGVPAYAIEHDNHMPMGWRTLPNGQTRTWDAELVDYGVTLPLLICGAHEHGSRHYWANAEVDALSPPAYGDRSQTGVMSSGVSWSLEEVLSPSTTVALTEVRSQNATYAFGGVSEPGGIWGSLLLVNQDVWILKYRHRDRETVAFVDGHVEQMSEAELLGPEDTSGNQKHHMFYRDVKLRQ